MAYLLVDVTIARWRVSWNPGVYRVFFNPLTPGGFPKQTHFLDVFDLIRSIIS